MSIRSQSFRSALDALRKVGVIPGAAAWFEEHGDDIRADMHATVAADVPAFAASGNPAIVPELQAHADAHVEQVLRYLHGAADLELAFVRAHAVRRAEQRFPLEATLHAYRCGHRVLSHWLREAALARAEQGDADILVGTQMLSKGHHFPLLTLVGIINADQGLFGTDFRSAERLAQSIIQVAGRAGRESVPGEVLIQTAFPEHPFWQSLIDGGYPRVAEESLAERRESRWPPFTRLALLRSAAHRQDDALHFLQLAADHLARQPSDYLRVLGPVNAPMAKKAGRYRAQLLIQSSDRKTLHSRLATLRPALEADASARKVRWSIDVDPIELF